MRPHALFALWIALGACDPKKDAATEPSAGAPPSAPPPTTAREKRPFTVVPEMRVDEGTIAIGRERIDASAADASAKLHEAVDRVPIDKQELILQTTPKAAIRDVGMVISALGKRGAASILLKMEGARKDLPAQYAVVPEARISRADGCSVVATVLEDLSTGVWPFKGGGGKKATKGRAGPDLSITGDNVTSVMKGCASKTAFFAASSKLRWEHAFHVGAVITKADKDDKLEQLVLLAQEPVAGLPVKLAAPGASGKP